MPEIRMSQPALNGLFKKAYELGVRCRVDVAVIIFDEKPGPPGKRHEYKSPHLFHLLLHAHPHPTETGTKLEAHPQIRANGPILMSTATLAVKVARHLTIAILQLSPGRFLPCWLSSGHPYNLNDMSRFPNDCGLTRPDRDPWARAQSAGYILASAISGERLATSPALLRFCTPSMRDLIFHAQRCTALSMVAVQWPLFVYPLLSQTAWSMLSYNITLTSDQRWNPLSTAVYNPPSNFSDQLSSTSSVLYIDPNAPNVLFTLPNNATSGLSSFAYTVGIRPEELFGICLTLFLAIIAAIIVVSLVLWFVDHVIRLITGVFTNDSSSIPGIKMSGTRSPGFSAKDIDGNDESKSLNSQELPTTMRPSSKFGLSAGSSHSGWRRWWRARTSSSSASFHSSVLHGNLVRVLVLFHLPVTIFSVYQMTLPQSSAPLGSRILAGLSFAIISCLIPIILVIRVRLTTTNKTFLLSLPRLRISITSAMSMGRGDDSMGARMMYQQMMLQQQHQQPHRSEISDLIAFFEAVDRGGGTGSPSSPSFVHALTSPNPNPNPNPNAGSSSDSWLDFQSNAAPASTIPLASSPDNPSWIR
ncbi:hypothetical protein BT96DRAFT_1097807 [Gymnopus androsaceus JB14]|uniref:MADS-box domain-containing protein n=1 Tax=Gymnopus androsaceus JB14 TaxID=1447944 RepID=A0A6A4GGY6_9AGAR|nr:hypothetical protein BT96DRAFT_1097807 [Gymnopus androsaceus JB14]